MAHPSMNLSATGRSDLSYPVLSHLGIVKDGNLMGPFAGIAAKFIMTPMMLGPFVDNLPSDRSPYTNPPLLQAHPNELRKLVKDVFGMAIEFLADEERLRSKLLEFGALCNAVAVELESVFAASDSTDAYLTFGIHHLFPDNHFVWITSTSPGIVLPLEADPVKYRLPGQDVKFGNPMRPAYFDMLRLSARPDYRRRYFASLEGTRNGLRQHPELKDAAKGILRKYLALGDLFEIRIGQPEPAMAQVTFVSSTGCVYSVRDPNEKKIAHNLTAVNTEDRDRWMATFEKQWDAAVPFTEAVVDELLAS
jgi:hypothetical protein